MIDIHSHILYDIEGDDGSRSLDMCQAFLKMSRKKHFISPIFRGLKEGKSKAKSKNAFYRSSFNVSLL